MGLLRNRRDEAVVGSRYRMRQRLLSVGDDYWIEHEDGSRAFRVDGKALRKTGGHMEAERIRSRRDKATLHAMFGNGDEMGGAPTVAGSGSALKPGKFILGKPGAAAGPDEVA